MDDPNDHHKGEQDDPNLEEDLNLDDGDKIGPTVGSPDPLQPTVADPNITPTIDLDRRHDEELAGEITADDVENTADDVEDDGTINSAVGWVAIVLAAISF